MQTKRRQSSPQIKTSDMTAPIRSRKISVYKNIEDALLSADLDKETLAVLGKLLNVKVNPELSRPEFAVEIAEQVALKYDSILDYILLFFPVHKKTDVALFLFFCFKIGFIDRNFSTIDNIVGIVACLSLFAPMSFIINMFRSYLSTEKKKEILQLMNVIEQSRDKKELAEINQCSYMPLNWKIKHCSFDIDLRKLRFGLKMKPGV
jgi:hypothetical protein